MTLKALAALISSLAVIIGAAFLIDERYAHAEKVNQAQQSIEQRVDLSVLQNRRWLIEDRLQTLEMVQTPSPAEQAYIKRYKRELDSVEQEIRQLKRR